MRAAVERNVNASLCSSVQQIFSIRIFTNTAREGASWNAVVDLTPGFAVICRLV